MNYFEWRYLCDILVKLSYRQTSSTSRTKSKYLNVFRLVLQLSLPKPMKPGFKSRMKLLSGQCVQAMLQLHEWSTSLLSVKMRLILDVER